MKNQASFAPPCLGRQSVAWESVRGSPPTWPQPIDLSDYYPVQPRIILLVFAFVFACRYLYLLVLSHLAGSVFTLLFFVFNWLFRFFVCLCLSMLLLLNFWVKWHQFNPKWFIVDGLPILLLLRDFAAKGWWSELMRIGVKRCIKPIPKLLSLYTKEKACRQTESMYSTASWMLSSLRTMVFCSTGSPKTMY